LFVSPRLVAFEDILAGRLDEIISDIIYIRARPEAVERRFSAAQRAIARSTREAHYANRPQSGSRRQQALFWDLPPVRLMCQAARKLEDAFAGNWSELVEEG
jgi:hypothetical protein